jgi:hypothetical protein
MIAISELFGIYEDWLAPKFPIPHTYYRARVKTNANLVLLTPAVTLNQARLGPMLDIWRAQIDVFNPTRLQQGGFHEGFFDKATPPCFLPESSSSRPTASQPRHAAPSYASGNTSAVSVSSGITATSQTTNARSYQSTSRRNSDHISGESSTNSSGKAATPLIIKSNHGFFKPLGDIVTEINRRRSIEERLKVPTLPHQGRNKPLCFRYCCPDGRGCFRGTNCSFIHLDLSNPQWIKDNVPLDFLHAQYNFLLSDGIREYLMPSPQLKDFLGRR